ncbi:MAG TPA: PKD domain-containing protein [Solirubrobacteraceae bacterium]
MSAALTLATAGAFASPAAAAETEVNFDNLAANTLVTTQYETSGLKLGLADELGQPPTGLKGDCGAPKLEEGPVGTPIKAASPPNYGLLPTCPTTPAAPPFSGTYGALIGAARGALSLEVSNVNPAGSADVAVKLIGYDSAWQEVANGETKATSGAWKRIELLVSGTDRISYFAIRTTEGSAQTVLVGIDNVKFEAEAGGEKEKEEQEKSGSGGSGGGSGDTGSVPPSPPTPPVAALALQGAAQPGAALTLTGAGSQPGNGRIISYDWDLNGDGTTDTSTATNPIAHVILPPGSHTIGLTVTSSTGQQSSSKFGVTIPPHIELPPPADGGEGPCEPALTIGNAQLIAECIQKLPGGGYAIETRQLALNGMVLTPRGGGYGVFKIRTVKDYAIAGTRTQLSGTPVNVELLNTPIGNVILGGRDLEAEPMDLEVHSGLANLKVPFAHGFRAHAAGNEATSKTLLMAIGAGQQCSGAESKHANCCPPAHENTACATLPGDFPLQGQIDIYLNNKGQALIDVQVGLRLKGIFEATGALEVEADPTGINLNSLKFTIPEAGLEEIFTVKQASFVYYFPDSPEESKRDTWQAKGKIVFGPLGEPALEGELAFKKGKFHSASLVFVAPPPGIPLYAGVYLNKLGGSIGVEPFAFGGTIGASIASQLELTLSFKYREPEGEELGFFGGQGQLSLKDNPIATLAADVYSDGYIDAQLKIDLKLPFGENPIVSVGGGLGFWDEPESGLWQAEGNVYMKLWEISAEVAGLVNNKYISGCLDFNTFGYSWGVQGRYSMEDGSVDGGGYGDSNCSDQLKQYKQKPKKEHKGGFVGGESLYFPVGGPANGLGQLTPGTSTGQVHDTAAAAAGESFSLPPHTLGQELRLTSTSGTPIVTLTSPSGQTYTTPAAPGHMIGDDGHFFSAILPDHNQVIVLLRHPQGGEWGIQTAPGSPAVSKLEVAEEVPPASVSVHVRRARGRRRTLAYKIVHFVPGTKVRFVERGRDSTHVLGVASAARGNLRFTPQDALGRRRRIVAYLLNSEGAPVRVLTAGHYTAPSAARGGRVRGARISRHGTTALLTWRPTAGARLYKITVEGSDGRVQRFDRKASGRSVTLTNVLPFESFTATVVADGGPNLLPGPATKMRLHPLRLAAHHRPSHRRGRQRKG